VTLKRTYFQIGNERPANKSCCHHAPSFTIVFLYVNYWGGRCTVVSMEEEGEKRRFVCTAPPISGRHRACFATIRIIQVLHIRTASESDTGYSYPRLQ